MNNIDKTKLADFLECDYSVFEDLNYNESIRTNYDDLKSKFPISTKFYKDIDNKIEELSEYYNLNGVCKES